MSLSYSAPYEVEWEDSDGAVGILRVKARSASDAYAKAYAKLSKRRDFAKIDFVSLDE